jgi:hypothetical protein
VKLLPATRVKEKKAAVSSGIRRASAMIMSRIAIVVGGLVYCACGGKLAPTMRYTVAVDPAFTSSQAEEVMLGLDEWRSAVPELRLTDAVDSCNLPSNEEVCIHPAYDPPTTSDNVIGTTRLGPVESATIWIYVARIRATGKNVRALLKQTAAHEMGHAMGLRHSPAGELMARDVGVAARLTQPNTKSSRPDARPQLYGHCEGRRKPSAHPPRWSAG